MPEITDEQKQARIKAMRLLEHMDRTEKGLADRLGQAGFSDGAVQNAMDYVKSFGYINDARYARSYISGRLDKKSKQQILQELYRKGVDRQTAQEAWEEARELEEPDERGLIRRTIEKKYSPGEELDEKGMRRLYGCLARRGFRQEDIFSVFDEMEIRKI
ncbi:MAG: regulatory protein RecX [Eubacteriales bacterium]|nr:regulatory protein RecX [Eubacteriales bacterium]